MKIVDSRFRILSRIASGGMGTVYLAQQRGAAGFQRLVAVKRAHPHLLEDPTVARMLAQEAHLSSLLRHPNVVSVTDVEESAGELFLVMEYVEGASLAEIQRLERPIPLAVSLRIILDVCEGLEALHRACDKEGEKLGLVHRDVSPQNVLVGVDGIARLADLGIARACAKQGARSLVRGKPSYMAAEYFATGRATPSSDIFALGVVAWEALTGARLYESDGLAAGGLRRGPPVPPSRLAPAIPEAIDDVILCALAADPARRFSSVVAFADALEEAARAASPGASAFAARAEVTALVTRLFGPRLRARREIMSAETPFDEITLVTDDAGTERPTAKPVGEARVAPSGRAPIVLLLGAACVVAVTSALSFALHESPPPVRATMTALPTTSAAVVQLPSLPSTVTTPAPAAVAARAVVAPAVTTRPPRTIRAEASAAPLPSAVPPRRPAMLVSAAPSAAPENPYAP